MEPVTASLWVWSGIFLLPNIILNIGLLITTFGRKIFKTFRYPQLFFQGIFGNFLFGPDRCFGGKLKVSGLWSGINFLLSAFQYGFGLLIMSRNFYWTFVFGDRSIGKSTYLIKSLILSIIVGSDISSMADHRKKGISALENELIIALTSFIMSWLCFLFVFLRIAPRGHLGRPQYLVI